jgi:SAM-dependent methyltransferase
VRYTADVTTENVGQMNVFDIVNYLNLGFTIPGGEDVINFWIQETGITSSSIILDVACSTGLVSRFIASKMGCTCFGIDIDPRAIDAANALKKQENLDELLHYEVQDATCLHFDNSLQFSHILFGNALAFIAEKDRARCIESFYNYLSNNGFLLVNNLFYKEEGDPKVLEELAVLFDLKVAGTCNYEYWNSLFEKKFDLIIEGELDNTCNYHLKEGLVRQYVSESLNGSKKFQVLPAYLQDAFFERLLKIRLKGNENHQYLDAKAQVWKKK